MMEENEMKRLVNVEELAGLLNVPKSWIYQRTCVGQKGIPHVKIGKYVRFDLEEVLNFFKKSGQLMTEGTK